VPNVCGAQDIAEVLKKNQILFQKKSFLKKKTGTLVFFEIKGNKAKRHGDSIMKGVQKISTKNLGLRPTQMRTGTKCPQVE